MTVSSPTHLVTTVKPGTHTMTLWDLCHRPISKWVKKSKELVIFGPPKVKLWKYRYSVANTESKYISHQLFNLKTANRHVVPKTKLVISTTYTNLHGESLLIVTQMCCHGDSFHGYWLISVVVVTRDFPFQVVLNCSGTACSSCKRKTEIPLIRHHRGNVPRWGCYRTPWNLGPPSLAESTDTSDWSANHIWICFVRSKYHPISAHFILYILKANR